MEGQEKPYFISYTIVDRKYCEIKAKYGGIYHSKSVHERPYYVEVRVGDYEFDNTEPPSEESSFPYDYYEPEIYTPMPLEDDMDGIRHCLWLATDFQYKNSLRALSEKKAKLIHKAKSSKNHSFSKETVERYELGEELTMDLAEIKRTWEERIKELSKVFVNYTEVLDSEISFTAEVKNRYYINSEGTRIHDGGKMFYIFIQARATSEDGADVWSYRDFYSFSEPALPEKHVLVSAINELAEEVTKLKHAPRMTPCNVPVIIKSPASGVFFHEVFGHRLEGHRQEAEKEGETFKDKVGKKIIPEFITIYDDPTMEYYKSEALIGHYLYDDEGVKARRVVLIENGVLRNFLLSRMPIENFHNSNGHGRKSITSSFDQMRAVPRQGVFVVESSMKLPYPKLKQLLLKECKKRNKQFGLIITRAYSGATITKRDFLQSFLEKPLVVYKVDVNTGREEMVRGIEFGGTPLVCIDKIVATDDTPAVFNGFCGAESGVIPVSAVAPSVLFSEMEFQKSPEEPKKPPLLLPPWMEE
jgi:predicted Zn-dependent protease